MLNEAVLAEYKSVRAEIEQLNGQIFTVLSTSLALDITILGWLFTKDNSSSSYAFPTIGIVLLFFGAVILLNRNRLAHRLAIFQKYFIESRVPDICWARVYFEYRAHCTVDRHISNIAERLAQSGTYVLFSAGLINVAILIWWGLRPFFQHHSTDVDWCQVFNLSIAIVFLCLPLWLARVMTDYRAIEATMQKIATQSGLRGDQ